MAGELGKACGRHAEAIRNYEDLLRGYISSKQKGAYRR